ncbi:hypothetical protein CSKR_200275 [Clonorchis sinensis]|uniref:Uncharacterized protein n=1 Tax=Clonorchis sinensis TaxID=79923 RepID=A0A8T1LZU2_CLOSI|nr:hypothetical protein CSKR_200275 [Clonorchis sinensis]
MKFNGASSQSMSTVFWIRIQTWSQICLHEIKKPSNPIINFSEVPGFAGSVCELQLHNALCILRLHISLSKMVCCSRASIFRMEKTPNTIREKPHELRINISF